MSAAKHAARALTCLMVTTGSAGAADGVTYADVAPIFAARCVKCHAAEGEMGGPPEGFRLDSYAATLSTDSWARVVPGSSEASELVRRIRGQARPRMPFDGPPYLSDAEIAVIVDWIDRGAPDASGNRAPFPAGSHVRVHGTLRPGWHVDDLEFIATPATRVDKSPATGDYVQLRGRLQSDGTVVADRLRRR